MLWSAVFCMYMTVNELMTPGLGASLKDPDGSDRFGTS